MRQFFRILGILVLLFSNSSGFLPYPVPSTAQAQRGKAGRPLLQVLGDRHSDRLDLILVGDEAKVRSLWTSRGGDPSAVRFVHAAQVITMEDKPTAALKDKRDSSLAVGMRYHQEGHADAFVSAGNTGAVLSAATLILGRVKGVSRPTIGTFIPAEDGECLLLDAGTNVDCRAQYLYEFGVMGSIYFQRVIGKDRPSVALLNVGEERIKGTGEAGRMEDGG